MREVQITKNELGVNVDGMDDLSVLKAVRKAHPDGVMITVEDYTAWIHPGVLLGSANADALTDDAVGLTSTACDLLRLAADANRAIEFGEPAAKRLLKAFIGGAATRAASKKVNQLHSVRIGVASKVALGDNVKPGEVHVARNGNVKKRLLQAFKDAGIVPQDCETVDNLMVIVYRHPVQLPYIATLREVDTLTKNLGMANRMEFRAVNRGDADGDTFNLFPIPTGQGVRLQRQLNEALATCCGVIDAALHVRGVAIDQDADTWAENPFADGKTVAKKMSQTFVMSCDEWLAKHEKMAEYANKYTPFSYRLSDIGAALAGLGYEEARTAGLIGAVIEEDFYLGLTGGPSELDTAMECWFTQRDSKAMRQKVFLGLGKVVRADLLTTPVRIAILEAARINQCAIDVFSPRDVLAHFAFLVGKGMTTTGKKDGPAIVDVFQSLSQFATGDDDVRESKRFLVRMAAYAAEKLKPILDEKRELFDFGDDDDFGASDDDISF